MISAHGLDSKLHEGRMSWLKTARPRASTAATLALIVIWMASLGSASAQQSQSDVSDSVTRGGKSTEAAAPLRLATWNIRWFPRGCPDVSTCPDMKTDLNLLSRRIAELNIDLLAVQEILYASDGQAAMSEVLRQLDSLTLGHWKVNLQECGAPESQRVGFLWNAERVRLSNFTDMEQLNGGMEDGGGACAANLRPGRYAYAEAVDGSVDFHAVTVHFDSGRRDRDYDNRRDATREISRLRLGEIPITDIDGDVIVFGDFNTMGQGEPVEITAAEEFRVFDSELGPSFQRLNIEPACSEYYRGRGGILDFFVVSRSLASPGLSARVAGYCAQNWCADLDEENMPYDYRNLSDHCPVVMDVPAPTP